MSGYSLEKSEHVISIRRFSFADQIKFSNFSGDFNPIHIDPVAARRTISGQCIVHGIHSLLWALDSLVKEKGITASEIKVRFFKPIFLEEEIKCVWNEKQQLISLLADEITLTTCQIKLGKIKANNNVQTNKQTPRNKPQEPTFLECSKFSNQPFKIFGNEKLSKELFSSFSDLYGSATACEIAAISQIIGMECPGLHSLFVSLKLQIIFNNNSIPTFGVTRSNERFKFLEISVVGNAVIAAAEAFYSPPPTSNLHISELTHYVQKSEFENIHALILGGSRGLGELVAKLIAAGGGKPIITYNVGKTEAARLVEEIHLWGGYCKAIQLTVNESTFLPMNLPAFNQVYYFPTPKIAGKRKMTTDTNLSQQFLEIYVKGFENVCKSIISKRQFTSVLYPSTVLIDNPTTELSEYISAKLEGENICQTLNKNKFLRILVPRLPPMDTDQNISLVKIDLVDSVGTMLPLLRKMSDDDAI